MAEDETTPYLGYGVGYYGSATYGLTDSFVPIVITAIVVTTTIALIAAGPSISLRSAAVQLDAKASSVSISLTVDELL